MNKRLMDIFHTNHKGDIGALKVATDLIEKGFIVSLPVSGHAHFDLIFTDDNRSYTVQCKYREIRRGCAIVQLRTNWANKSGGRSIPYKDGDFDYLAVYVPDIDECLYVPHEELIGKLSISFRIEETFSGQKVKIKDYKNYLSPHSSMDRASDF